MHTHDEIAAEVPNGFGSVEEFRALMGTLPPFAADWPVRVPDAWEGPRYGKW